MKLFDGTFRTIEKSLDFATAKNRTITSNIANVDTPHYKAKDVIFKDVLSDAMARPIQAKRTHEKHLPFSNERHTFRTIHRRDTVYHHNGNNVDIDKEMADLAKNQIYYQSLIDRLNGKFRSLQTVIRGGSGS